MASEPGGIAVAVWSPDKIVADALVSLVASDNRFTPVVGGVDPHRCGGPRAVDVLLMYEPSLTADRVVALAQVAAHPAQVPIVVVTHDCCVDTAMRAYEVGASAVLRGSEGSTLLLGCLELVHIQGPLIWGGLAEEALKRSRSTDALTDMSDLLELESGGCLTRRECEVARALVRCLSTAEIARELGVSPKTVRNHISNVFAKTGYRSRGELMTRLRSSSGRATRHPASRTPAMPLRV